MRTEVGWGAMTVHDGDFGDLDGRFAHSPADGTGEFVGVSRRGGRSRPAGGRGVEGLEGSARFTEAALTHLRGAQAALTDLLDEAGLGGARPTEIGRRLGVDKTLAWKIARFVDSSEAAGAARHMPGSAGVEIVLKAASARGVAGERLDAVREADRRLRAFVRDHAGDRRSFEAMIGHDGRREDSAEFEQRRAYFRAGSAIWGVRARVQVLMLALRPSSSVPGMIDVLQLSGMFGFERLRSDVPWIIRRLTNRSDSGSSSTGFVREPLDASGVAGDGKGLPLVPRFCSKPLPEIRQFEGWDGTLYDEIAPGPVGRHGAVTFVAGEIYRGAVPLAWSADNREGRYRLSVRTPVELVLFDLLLHKDLSHFGDAETRVYGQLEDRPSVAGAAQPGAMYEPREAERLGGASVLQTPRLSGYARMASEALRMAGWGSADAFRGYRTEASYPVAPCDVVMACPITAS